MNEGMFDGRTVLGIRPKQSRVGAMQGGHNPGSVLADHFRGEEGRRRHGLISVALARGVPYRGADFDFTPPPRPRVCEKPSIAVIGTGSLGQTGQLVPVGDTAGLRDSGDAVEQEGVRRAAAEMTRADRVLFVIDTSVDPQGRAYFRISAPSAQSVVIGIGRRFALAKGEDGVWSGSSGEPLPVGFHYYNVYVDGTAFKISLLNAVQASATFQRTPS